MKFMKAFLAVLLFVPSLAFSYTAVISDIDDTIKISHVLSFWDKIRLSLKTEPFWQMPELYRALETSDVQFFYVSSAPEELMGEKHEKFLRKNSFPDGLLALPELNDRDEHKVRQIRKILADNNIQTVLFFGDNGEIDPQVYDQMRKEFEGRGIEFKTYIREAYNHDVEGSPLAEGQIGFASTGELGLFLWNEGLLTYEKAMLLLNKSMNAPRTFKQAKRNPVSALGLPDWVDCSKHKIDLQKFYRLAPEVSTFESLLKQRCK